jgi:hypothetical protein
VDEGLRLKDQEVEDGPRVTLIGHRKVKSTWVMQMVSNKSRRRMMALWNLVEDIHAFTLRMMNMVSVKSRTKAKALELHGGWTHIDIS